MNPRRTALLLTTTALTLSSCSSARQIDTAPWQSPDLDAKSYYDEYAVAAEVDYTLGTSPETATGSNRLGTDTETRDPGLLDDNTFVDAGTSGPVDPRQDPLSTFALDVDTGSFSVARTLLASELLPPAESIRPEEWVNAFDYHQPAPTDSDLAVLVEAGHSPDAGDDNQVVRVGIKAREISDAQRPPVALTMVIDTSGSMDIRERLGLVKSSLALLAEHLRPSDTIAVVTYEDDARPVLAPTPVRNTAALVHAIEDLRPGGSTNLAAGLRLGYQQARAAYRPDAVNVVILASDGVANVGMTGPDALTRMISRGGDEGIHLVTVGFGMGNYNDDLMEQLADQGDGFYAYVDTFSEAERLFVDELTSTLTPVALDAKVQVEFDATAVSSYRLIGYDNRAIADDHFTDDDADAGEIGAGHDVTALYEVALVDSIQPGTELGTATVRWQSVATGTVQQQTSAVVTANPETPPSDAFRLAGAVADFAQLLKNAGPAADRAVGLGVLAQRAAALEASGVDGASQLHGLILRAQIAR